MYRNYGKFHIVIRLEVPDAPVLFLGVKNYNVCDLYKNTHFQYISNNRTFDINSTLNTASFLYQAIKSII